MFQKRTYRETFNSSRFRSFNTHYLETDLWIGVDPDSWQKQMEELSLIKVMELRQRLDTYIKQKPQFAKTLLPYKPLKSAPVEVLEMAESSARAGIGPMASVAGLFSREVGEVLLQNFSLRELVIENGGDIFALVEQKLVLTVFAGNSTLSEKIGIVIPARFGKVGICTSAGTIGPSLSFGRADAVAVVCRNVLLADAFATALGNEVKSAQEIEEVLKLSERFPEIISVVIICDNQVGMRGNLEVKIIK